MGLDWTEMDCGGLDKALPGIELIENNDPHSSSFRVVLYSARALDHNNTSGNGLHAPCCCLLLCFLSQYLTGAKVNFFFSLFLRP
ncbi:hypothetical protein E2C01_100948 [Portunus trituberculatus]|uniref:Uncharacterized protein n=1 Tax=Portunus trituberculatus TaxID=210409 RepID=A0A5B7KEW3_PORTR|nr:hypothetical protein [Portunus trituberculatus]